MNNNNFNNTNRACAVANLRVPFPLDGAYMVKLEDLLSVYYRARSNKRRSRDSVRFEIDFKDGLLNLWKKLNERTFTASSNYAFVVRYPKPREIFATVMETRIVHHYMDWRLRSIYESVLSDRSFNNRKGLGLHKAIETYRNDIRELSENYTVDVWCAHMDLKGYFPNADVETALSQQLRLIEMYYNGEDKEDLKYMMTACMRADPARNCNVYVSKSNWDVIPPDKSLFKKPVGTGAAIGFLCWQNAMGMYINDVIKWLQIHLFLRVMVFVDDIYIVTNDKSKFLALMPILRSKLATLKVRMNESKFYLQHYSKGVMCLGRMLKFNRQYMDNKSYGRALDKVEILAHKKEVTSESMMCSLNSHLGGMKGIDQFNRMVAFVDKALLYFSSILLWNNKKMCFNNNVKNK